MANLTSKELGSIEDQLSKEAVMVKKFRAYSQAAQDPAIRSKYEQIAGKHQEHYNRLYSYLN